MAAPSIGAGITQLSLSEGATWSSSQVGNADGAIAPVDLGNAFNSGIDPSNTCQQIEDQGTSSVGGNKYSALSPSWAAVDISAPNQAIFIHIAGNPASFNRVSTDPDGITIYAFDSAGAYTTDYLLREVGGADDTFFKGAPVFFPVSLFAADATSVGTPDNTDITRLGVSYKVTDSGDFGVDIRLNQIVYIDGEVEWADGDGVTPGTLSEYYDLLFAESGFTFHSLLAEDLPPAYGVGTPVRINSERFEDSDFVFIFTQPDTSAGYVVPATGYFSLSVTPDSATAVHSYTNGLFAYAGGTYPLTIDGSIAADVTATRCTFLNTDDVALSGGNLTMVGCTIPDATSVSLADGDFDVLNISGCAGPVVVARDLAAGSTVNISGALADALQFDLAPGDYGDLNFSVDAGDVININPSAAGVFELQGISAGGAVEFDNLTALNVTVNISAGLVASVINGGTTTGGGTITLVQPVVAFELTNLVAGSTVRVYATGTQTLLADVASSGTSFTWEYAGTPTVDYTVYHVQYGFVRVVGVPLGTAGFSTPVSQVEDRAYEVSSGLTFGTTATIDTGTQRFGVTVATTVQNWYSFWKEEFIAQTSLDNVAFPLSPFGPDSYSLDGYEFDGAASINNLSRDGFRYVAGGVSVAEWCAILSTNVGDVSAFQARYQQQAGTGTTNALALGAVDQVIQTYGDATHGNFDFRGHLVFKMQPNGYRQAVFDVVNTLGLSALGPVLYVISLDPVAIDGFVTGDPSATGLALTNYGASPITREGELFSAGIVDSAANSAETIHRWLNWNISQGGTFQGEDAFNWPDFIFKSGTTYQTNRGRVQGSAGATLKGLFVERSGPTAHPGFFRQQADDGTFFVLPVTATGTVTGIEPGSRLKVRNVTQATTTFNGVVAGTSYVENYTDGGTYSDGDTIEVFLNQQSGLTAKLRFNASTVASSSGWAVVANQQDDTVYAGYGLDGSTLVTKFTPDYIDDEVDIIAASNFTGQEVYAWLVYNETTSQGIDEFFGGFTAIDAANIRFNNVLSLFFDNLTADNKWQTDNIRLFREDGARPVRHPTTGGGGVDVNWRERVFLQNVGGGPLTGPQAAQLAQASEAQEVNTKIGTPVVTVSDDIAAIQATVDPLAAAIAAVQSGVDAVPTSAQNADRLLGRSIQGGADGGRTVLQAFRANRNRFARDDVNGVIRVYEEDDVTVSHEYAFTAADVDTIIDADPA